MPKGDASAGHLNVERIALSANAMVDTHSFSSSVMLGTGAAGAGVPARANKSTQICMEALRIAVQPVPPVCGPLCTLYSAFSALTAVAVWQSASGAHLVWQASPLSLGIQAPDCFVAR